MKFKIGATIPTTQYGNIMPELEVEAETFEEAQSLALPEIEKLWKRYAEPGKELRESGKRIKAFVGGEIDYDDFSHTYSWNGDVYLSGSQYAKQFEKPFDGATISEAMAKKYGVSASDIVSMWRLKSDISAGFGTAIHAAIEMYERYGELAKSLNKTSHLHDHPIIKKAVESFYALQDNGHEARVEAVVVDHEAKRAGRIDRLVITGEKKCRIQDIKTNADITKYLPVYWKQLEFYEGIMGAAGWTVEGLDIFHWDGEWHKHAPISERIKRPRKGE